MPTLEYLNVRMVLLIPEKKKLKSKPKWGGFLRGTGFRNKVGNSAAQISLPMFERPLNVMSYTLGKGGRGQSVGMVRSKGKLGGWGNFGDIEAGVREAWIRMRVALIHGSATAAVRRTLSGDERKGSERRGIEG